MHKAYDFVFFILKPKIQIQTHKFKIWYYFH